MQSKPWEKYAQPQSGYQPTTIGTPDPSFPYKGPQAAADLGKTSADTTKTVVETSKTQNDIQKDNRGQIPPGYRLSADGKSLEVMPGFDPAQGNNVAQRNAAIQALHNSQILQQQIDNIRSQYSKGPGQTKGIKGVFDYNPLSQTNTNFDVAGSAPRGLVGQALGFTGGQLNTPQEAAAAVGPYLPKASDYDSTIVQKIQNLQDLADQYRQLAIQQIGGVPDQYGNVAHPSGAPVAAPNAAGGGNAPPPAGGGVDGSAPIVVPGNGGGGGGGFVPSDGQVKSVPDPQGLAQAQKLNQLLTSGAPDAQIRAFAETVPGINPDTVTNALTWRSKHPGYKGAYDFKNFDTKDVALSGVQAASNKPIIAPLGSLLSGALTGVTGSFDDELAGRLGQLTGGDYTQSRDRYDANKRAIAAANPGSNIVGNMIGGAGALAFPELAIGKLGYAGDAAKIFNPASMGIDAAYGGIYGAGDNNQNRLGGAETGVLGGVAGGMLGRTAFNGVGRLIAPSGGELGTLYENGVRPTIGQRFANTGWVGKGINTAEQAAQSIPGLGALVYRARNIPREQFQIGAFNNALSDIGDQLPKGMKPGTDPHAYMQNAFDREYDAARSGMRFAADPQYQQDMQQFGQTLSSGVLNGDQAGRVQKIINTAVDSRLRNGQLSGDAYKAAASEISAASRKLAKSDPLMADALHGYTSIMDGAARRNSSPEAVTRLDNADRGYAKAVRIEDAAARRGGDTGEFTPTGFDSAVQKASGGVRSREYLRGDALMSDYANAGKSLVDTLPNSGTAERLFTGQLAAGGPATTAAGYLLGMPALLKAGVALAPYLPGGNAVTTRILSPRDSVAANAIGKLVRNNARLGGMFGSPLIAQQLSSGN